MEFMNSFSVTPILCFLTTLLFLYSFISNWIKTRNYPPGPLGLPLVGYVPFLGKLPSDTIWKLGKKYGDIFSFYVGPRLVICVNDRQMMKKILSNPLTLARPEGAADSIVGKAGFTGLDGEKWQDHRNFVTATMRNVGMGRGVWETLTRDCASDFVKEIQQKNGLPFCCEEILSLSVINTFLSVMFGRHLDVEKEKDYIEITSVFMKSFMKHLGSLDLAVNNTSLVKIAEFLNLKDYKLYLDLLRKFESIFEKEVNERAESKEKSPKEDFIGHYLQEIEKRNKSNKNGSLSLETLRGDMFVLLVGGRDSVMLPIGWLLLLMAAYPEVQQKICEEIDKNIGRGGVVYFEDRVNLPYTKATLYEMLRFISINPFFPPRRVMDDFQFAGYTIPKDSHIVCNSWAMSHDPRYIEDPMTFRPERFLMDNGTKLKSMENYGFFSFGKRNCPGESVALMSMYLYFVSIMQKFTIKMPKGGQPDMEYKYCGAVCIPNPQELCFIER
ncbi:hypothetical protein JTE90_023406 [Oedothorax gibbosus]|uniref:Cytochrome P450 n=1 Tax=Oedothorax gibbosus TaxID=931172 RepID=A0AAV6UE66_9ARAC|nr:hypothetical protein JTE90_023406 [Oedothorax gibbosus]